MASSRAEERRRETDAIIANNRSLQKELSPTYSLDDVDFNEQNRIAKLSFQKTINYRTVDRYIQKNYERYPIYSGWKTKRSFIKKRIKLTNSELEKLNCNADSLIASITTDDLQAFFAAMPPSRSRDLCAVHVGQLFKKAYALGVIKRNPFENVEIKKHAPQKRSALTVEEQTAFLQAAKSSSYFLLFRTLLATGLRIGEALALSPADIQDGKITVSKDIVFVGGKKIIQPPKSKAAFRSVPIPEDIYKALAQIRTERIFSVSYNTVRLAFRRVSQKLGFTVTPHILRHTYATRLEEAGIPPKIKQYLMGHASLHMTQDTYTDAQTAYIENANESVRAVFDTK